LEQPVANQEHSYTVPSGAMDTQKRDGNDSHSKNNLIQNSGESEENGYQIPDSNK
jgi:hypothetical protein